MTATIARNAGITRSNLSFGGLRWAPNLTIRSYAALSLSALTSCEASALDASEINATRRWCDPASPALAPKTLRSPLLVLMLRIPYRSLHGCASLRGALRRSAPRSVA